MKYKALTIIALVTASVTLSAQENEAAEKIRYSNITEAGFMTTSHIGVAFEATTVQGFSFDKQHHLGFGVGIGMSSHFSYHAAYMPLFVNYRYYFNPKKNFSPHVNASLGGLIKQEGAGIYSAFTAGFRHGKFSFSSGLSFMAVEDGYGYYWRQGSQFPIQVSYPNWTFPFGITMKLGFAF